MAPEFDTRKRASEGKTKCLVCQGSSGFHQVDVSMVPSGCLQARPPGRPPHTVPFSHSSGLTPASARARGAGSHLPPLPPSFPVPPPPRNSLGWAFVPWFPGSAAGAVGWGGVEDAAESLWEGAVSWFQRRAWLLFPPPPNTTLLLLPNSHAAFSANKTNFSGWGRRWFPLALDTHLDSCVCAVPSNGSRFGDFLL